MSESNIKRIHRPQSETLGIITTSHKISSIDYLHNETEMLYMNDHMKVLYAQYLVYCLDIEHVCHHITNMDHPPREMKEEIFTGHNKTVIPLLTNMTHRVLILNNRHPPIYDEETYLSTTTVNSITAPFAHCKLRNSYKEQTDS